MQVSAAGQLAVASVRDADILLQAAAIADLIPCQEVATVLTKQLRTGQAMGQRSGILLQVVPLRSKPYSHSAAQQEMDHDKRRDSATL